MQEWNGHPLFGTVPIMRNEVKRRIEGASDSYTPSRPARIVAGTAAGKAMYRPKS